MFSLYFKRDLKSLHNKSVYNNEYLINDIKYSSNKFTESMFNLVRRIYNNNVLAKNGPPNGLFFNDFMYPPIWLHHHCIL